MVNIPNIASRNTHKQQNALNAVLIFEPVNVGMKANTIAIDEGIAMRNNHFSILDF